MGWEKGKGKGRGRVGGWVGASWVGGEAVGAGAGEFVVAGYRRPGRGGGELLSWQGRVRGLGFFPFFFNFF